ncbi:MAG: DUF2202 domain-containing protein [Pirellulaceae bacterium]
MKSTYFHKISVGCCLLALIVTANAALAQGRQNRGGRNQRGGSQFVPAATQAPQLSTTQVKLLLEMQQEEKLAHDVYVALGKSSGIPIFKNISAAESQHMQAIHWLLGKVPPEYTQAEGKFAIDKFQTLYEELVKAGSSSQLAAVMVGAKIEELDIKDLQTLLATEQPSAVRQVLENLQRGSRNHLRAFAAQISSLGGNYSAEFLSQTEFDQIAASPTERGGGAGKNGGQAGKSAGRRGRNRQK